MLVTEVGLEDWPGAQGSFANGDTVFHHDMQQKVIDGHNMLAVSYWDAGQVLLNIDDPANPVFVGDSDFEPRPGVPGVHQPEGNSHQSYFDQDGDWLISTDEDFSPTRTLFEITDGPERRPVRRGRVRLHARIPSAGVRRSAAIGVRRLRLHDRPERQRRASDRSEVPSAASTGADTVVFSRGACFFSDKVAHRRGGRLQSCSSARATAEPGTACSGRLLLRRQGSEVLGTAYGASASAIARCTCCSTTRRLQPPEGYAAGGDLPAIGTRGATSPQSDLRRLGLRQPARRAPIRTCRYVDTTRSRSPRTRPFRSGFGNLTVHEVKTDPRQDKDLAYFSYYRRACGWRRLAPAGCEIGHYIAEGGNDFWGVFPVCAGQCELNERQVGTTMPSGRCCS